ncbi:MAG: hypothetical protein F6J87_13785 [Spirulina sp. SIO3F2]|nr:hypothetical protein [Spirulina sp. SIO3F2]
MDTVFGDWEIEDLRIVRSEMEEFDKDDDAEYQALYCVYSFKLDSVTFVDENERKQLLKRGVLEIDELPSSLETT